MIYRFAPVAERSRVEADLTFVNQAAGLTAIARTWPPGTTWLSCRRCPRASCSLTAGTCLVLVPKVIPDADAPDFAFRGRG